VVSTITEISEQRVSHLVNCCRFWLASGVYDNVGSAGDRYKDADFHKINISMERIS